MRYITAIFILIFFVGCSAKQPIKTQSATVIFKTPVMKFYDKGFVTKYEDHIHLQVFAIGKLVLDLKVYKDEVCQSVLECMDAEEFNLTYLHESYKEDFLYNLFSKDKIYHKDREHNIFIKVK